MLKSILDCDAYRSLTGGGTGATSLGKIGKRTIETTLK
jgi:hypothetical protein